jgi:hypothetical protein
MNKNQFAENQLTPEKGHKSELGPPAGIAAAVCRRYFATDDRVVERNVCAFAPWASANEWLDDDIRWCRWRRTT